MEDQEKIWDIEYKRNKDKWNREQDDLPNILKNKKVLELGVGNGKTLKAILKQKPRKVIAVDFSLESIRLVKSTFTNKGIEFIKSNVQTLPFKDQEFDVIVSYYVLNSLLEKERKKAIEEIFRIIKKRGKILFQDFSVGDFREKNGKEKIIEEHSIQKKNYLICHFFTIKELNNLFKGFKSKNLKLNISSPITHKPNLKRKIISGIITK